MTCTIEISLYPLHREYPSSVLTFLQKLRDLENIEIQSNGMSSVIIGDFDVLWPQLGGLITAQFDAEESIFVLKVAAGRKEYVD